MIAAMESHARGGRGSAAMNGLRRHFFVLFLLAVLAPVYFVWTWSGQMGEFANDGPNYLMMARHFADPGARGIDAQVAAVSRFPPLYPLLLAWCGAAADLNRAHAVTTAAFLLALVALYAWLRRQGLSAAAGAFGVLLCALLPQSWLFGLTVQSEYLYLLWSLLALLMLSRWGENRRREVLYAAALAVAASVLTRTIGVALLVPLAVAAWRAPRRTGLFALGIALAPVLTWHALHRPAHSYQSEFALIYGRAPLQLLLGQIGRELPALHKAWLENFGSVAVLALVMTAFGLLCLAATLWRARRLLPDPVYLLVYGAILLVWPFPEEATRFVWVIVPLLVVQPLLVLAEFRQPGAVAPVPAVAPAITATLILVAVMPGLLRAVQRYESSSPLPDARTYTSWYKPDPAEAEQEVRAEIVLAQDLRQIESRVPAQDCVLSVRPDLVNFYGRRRAVSVPLNSVPDPQFQQQLRASGCPYLFMSTRTDANFPDALHPVARLGEDIDVLYYNAVPNPEGTTHFIISMLARMK
jgi:hypothetical protein